MVAVCQAAFCADKRPAINVIVAVVRKLVARMKIDMPINPTRRLRRRRRARRAVVAQLNATRSLSFRDSLIYVQMLGQGALPPLLVLVHSRGYEIRIAKKRHMKVQRILAATDFYTVDLSYAVLK